MNQFFRIIIFVVLVATSCSRNVIDADDMPNILADIYLADRAVLTNPSLIQKADSSLIYEPILNKYGYTTEDFLHTIDYYLPRPTKLRSFFIKAKDILTQREAVVSKKMLTPFRNDSLISPLKNVLDKIDSLPEMDSYERSLRWIAAPEKLPVWRLYFKDSLAVRYEIPEQEQWWFNNLTTKRKSMLEYEKNSSTIHFPPQLPTDQKRIPLPERRRNNN